MAFKPLVLGIPLKRASDVDVLKPLKNVVTSRYQSAEQESYITAINEFSKLRASAVGKTLDYHENSLETLYKYHDQIVSLESKIPASELQIPFKWKDAFDKGHFFSGRSSKTVSMLSFERACVMFNIAALQSQVASTQSTDSDEGLKMAAKLLQQSAGTFNYLKGWVLSAVGSEPTADMQPDTLSALSALMLAQAQEVFVTKAAQDNMKSSIIAKLCMQAEELFGEAARHMSRETLKPLWEREWLSIVAGKQMAFNALAHFYQARVCNEQKAVGEEISRLRHALELFKSAETRSGNTGQVSSQISKAQSLLNDAVKDNDFIYHERVPDIKSLTPIGKAPVAKLIPVQDRFSSNFTDLFETLVPVAVQQALSQFDTRKTDIVNTEVSKLKESTQLLNSILASLNLPAALEEKMSGEQLPPSMREKSLAVVEKGGLEALERTMKELPELLQRNTELLDECDRQMKEESDSDSQLRTQFKERWTRTPSATLTSNFIANATKYRKVIETAVQADSTVKSKLEANREGIEMLSRGPDFLSQSLPSPASVNPSSGNTAAVTTLRTLMNEVDAIKTEREVLEIDLKSTNFDMKDSFLSALASDGAINEPALSVEKLGEVFKDLQRQVKDNLQRQEQVIVKIQEGHERLMSESGAAGGERERLLKMVATSYDIFMELSDNLREGTKFYNDLTQLLVTFQGKITDYCFARRTEKEELLKDLTSGIVSSQPSASVPTTPAHHTAETNRAAPPRPPPPTAGAPPAATAPVAPNPYQGAPTPAQGYPGYPAPAQPAAAAPGQLPYPVQPQGMPAPPGGYGYPQYPVYTPMPQGYNPYFPQSTQYPPYPQQQAPGYPGYPQQGQQPPQWPPKP